MPTLNNDRTILPHLANRKPAPRAAEDFSFYNTAAWRKLSAVYLRAHPVCAACEASGKPPYLPAVHTDHCIARDKHGGAELDWANLMALCKGCHGTKTRIEADGPLCFWVETGSGRVPAPGGKAVIIEKVNRNR